MIQLIACDLDGTLISHEHSEVPPELFTEIQALKELGIRFCPASGRQLSSLQKLFDPVKEELYYLAENGAAVYDSDRTLYLNTIDHETAVSLCNDILSTPGCDLLISCDNMSYLCTTDQDYIRHMIQDVRNNVTVLERPEDVPDPMIKISAYVKSGPKTVEEYFRNRWGSQFEVAIAGKTWLDFTKADKGIGIRFLCETLKIPLEDVVAFGDNYNDVPMLDIVGVPYIMNTAVKDLKNRYPNHCDAVVEEIRKLRRSVAL